jgi:hypothetical protein
MLHTSQATLRLQVSQPAGPGEGMPGATRSPIEEEIVLSRGISQLNPRKVCNKDVTSATTHRGLWANSSTYPESPRQGTWVTPGSRVSAWLS